MYGSVHPRRASMFPLSPWMMSVYLSVCVCVAVFYLPSQILWLSVVWLWQADGLRWHSVIVAPAHWACPAKTQVMERSPPCQSLCDRLTSCCDASPISTPPLLHTNTHTTNYTAPFCHCCKRWNKYKNSILLTICPDLSQHMTSIWLRGEDGPAQLKVWIEHI